MYIRSLGRALTTHISAKQGEHLEQDQKNTRRKLKTSQPDDLPGNRRECQSAITDHTDRNNCIIDWEGAKVTDRECNRKARWIKEALWIRKTTPVMNRDEGGYRLSHVWDGLLIKTLASRGRTCHRRTPVETLSK